jgi:HAUS augmin-like complex subunit 3
VDSLENKQLVAARISAAHASARLAALQNGLAQVRTRRVVLDVGVLQKGLKQKLETKQQAVVELQLAENECNNLADAAASMQHTSVLLGDYKLRLARQDYLSTRQDELIGRLVEQRARGELLRGLFAADAAQHHATAGLFGAIRQYAAHRSEASDQRHGVRVWTEIHTRGCHRFPRLLA